MEDAITLTRLEEQIHRISSEPFPACSHQADVWLLRVDGTSLLREKVASLSAVEQLRAKKFKSAHVRTRFIFTHWVLRLVVAAYCKVHPNELAFGENAFGKPYLIKPNSKIAFNLSHSGSYAAIVITTGASCGIDIEIVKPRIASAAIASYYFTREENLWLNHFDEQKRLVQFFRIWAFKEAALKAAGTGLSADISSVNVIPLLNTVESYFDLGSCQMQYWARELDLVDGYKSAVVIEGPPHEMRIFAISDI